MIQREAWLREADERQLKDLHERLSRGDTSAAQPFWQSILRLPKWPEWISYEAVMNSPDEVLERLMPGHKILRSSQFWQAYSIHDEGGSTSWEDQMWEADGHPIDEWEIDENWEASGEHPLGYLVNILAVWRHARSGHGNPTDAASTIFGDFEGAYEISDYGDEFVYYAREELTRIAGPYEQQIADLAWRHAKRTPNP